MELETDICNRKPTTCFLNFEKNVVYSFCEGKKHISLWLFLIMFLRLCIFSELANLQLDIDLGVAEKIYILK